MSHGFFMLKGKTTYAHGKCVIPESGLKFLRLALAQQDTQKLHLLKGRYHMTDEDLKQVVLYIEENLTSE